MIAAAQDLWSDPLKARAQLGRMFPGADADMIRSATLQAELAHRARTRFPALADEVVWSRDGLEQASRPAVSSYRAGRLRAAGVTRVLDMTAGIGLDALAFAAAGMRVDAVEADPATAALAAANAEHLGQGRMRVFIGDCRNPEALSELPAADAWFIDPARRTAVRGAHGEHRRLDDPESWSPPWSWVLAQAARVGSGRGPRMLMVKAAPGLPHEAIIEVPGTAVDAEWVSVSGQLLETCVTWRRCPDADASAPRRAAVVIDGSGDDAGLLRIESERGRAELTNSDVDGPAAAGTRPHPGIHLHDPDPAIVRAHLVAEFAIAAGAELIDPKLAYLTSTEPLRQPWRAGVRSWRVLDAGPYDPRRLRTACADHGIETVEVTGRGRRLDPARVRRDLRLPKRPRSSESARATLIVLALGAERTTWTCLALACSPR